jgi:hypothetical protein
LRRWIASVTNRFTGAFLPYADISAKAKSSFYLNIDFVSHVALVALAEENGRQSIVGDGRYVVSEPGQAEVAFTVVGAYRCRAV